MLGEHNTYKSIPTDLTTKQKSKLFSLLKNIKNEGGLETILTSSCTLRVQDPHISSAPKIHKVGAPLKPMVIPTEELQLMKQLRNCPEV